MRKILSVFLSLSLCLCTAFSSAAAAADVEAKLITNEESFSVTYTNEYEYVQYIQSASAEELADLDMTEEEADEYLSAFQDALDERAALSEEELLSMGYTNEEVYLLKKYDDGETLSGVELTTVTGTCTGRIYLTSTTTRSAKFYYYWSWDHCPLITMTDSAAIVWTAYDSEGDSLPITLSYYNTYINYYYSDSYRRSESGTVETTTAFDAIKYNIEMLVTSENTDRQTEKYYAKCGGITINLTLDSDVDNTINFIRAAALYGHSLLGLSAPSIGISLTTGDISISFTPTSTVDSIAGDKVKISCKSGSITHLL